ncbi:MAG TPA: hypothetical protein VGP64_13415 [Polyangia bacterium]|jgi:hypothetical protein
MSSIIGGVRPGVVDRSLTRLLRHAVNKHASIRALVVFDGLRLGRHPGDGGVGIGQASG